MAIKPLLAITIAIGVVGGLYGAMAYLHEQNSELERQLTQMAEEGNAELPTMVDTQTRLDSMSAESDNRFEYTYTLVNLQTSQIDRETLERNITPQLKKLICTESGTEVFRSNGVDVVYTYHGNDGGQVASVVIPSSECASSA